MAELLVPPGPTESVQNGAGLSEQTRPVQLEREASVPQSKQLAMCQSRLCQNEKEQSHLSGSPDRELGESQSK